ncbi:MAG TPA: STAS/SEC14 domain-containing protein [Agitococcus sp.]|nr:STAS/SEC14 domain-containing protein [Agitococcus sp.]
MYLLGNQIKSIALGLFEQNLAIAKVSGILMRNELDQAKKWVFEHIKQHGKKVVLVVIEPEFEGLEESVEWQDIEHDEYIQQHTKALAIVGSEQWP